ncbi:cobalamin-independent methionine synthase II family protein [Microbaculum marinisediminis]|uniref:Cobalamin-independent methionine synthase II family protein n=1 Tax=Microbaculum marinisediminis TaxID=2931392 RepID=A0AAW5R1W8_9HYPH|nr:cobalamin-independent methionine synthase II family protein [Microbaculum sp. A6E488]MCT8973968.1 cobalamin-independent methionine synthase II family protein [Microbaculum sp. A6E488]
MANIRFRTTHVGSLPRGETLAGMLIAREAGEKVDASAFDTLVDERVEETLTRQIEAGVDWVNDGEQGRAGFQTYVADRMTGFGGESRREAPLDYERFPTYAAMARRGMGNVAKVRDAPMAIGEVAYESTAEIEQECARLARHLANHDLKPGDAFLTAPSPGIVATTLQNAHYKTHDDYLNALAGELRKEYGAILDAGFALQIDAPDIAMERCTFFKSLDTPDFLVAVERHLEALNAAIEGIPPERIRLHCCWGNWAGPHVHDIPLRDVIGIFYRANVGAFSIPFANPRHQHEYEVFREFPFPKEVLLLPGIVDTTCNYIEHPEVVARRVLEAVGAIGDAERVVPSTDCGFGTFAGYEFVAEELVWEKLSALREGADIAAKRL